MKTILSLLVTSLIFVGCKQKELVAEEVNIEKVTPKSIIYVGESSDLERCPYRYTIVKKEGLWSGEIEVVMDEQSIFFDTMKVVSSSDDKSTFNALLGGPGKALPMSWELSLSKTKEGYDGVLVATGVLNEFEPIQLKFKPSEIGLMPSSEYAKRLEAMSSKAVIVDELGNVLESQHRDRHIMRLKAEDIPHHFFDALQGDQTKTP